MKYFLIILSFIIFSGICDAQDSAPDFRWSNSLYFNLNEGDSIQFRNKNIRLLSIDHQYSRIQVENDTVNLRVARRSVPVSLNGIQLFVADNRNVANLTPNDSVHSLLTGDALICLTDISENWLSEEFAFPVSFNHGFLWRGDEDAYQFSLVKDEGENLFSSYPGVGIDLNDAKGKEKHWLVALENSIVEWVEETDDNTVCICLSSNNSPGIYYLFDKLFTKTLDVRKGQTLEKGELLGTAWGDDSWGHVQLAVVYSESVPQYHNRFTNCVNAFPQLFSLYYRNSVNLSNYFSKGKIEFGRSTSAFHNSKNASAVEDYLGKGWKPCSWNTAEKLDWVSKGEKGNVRISKILFKGTSAEATNPNNFCDYEINVRNGVYRIRALVGDVERKSWQNIEFEGIAAGIFELDEGQQKWTPEKVVRVEDMKLTVRIYFDNSNKSIAGLSELVFQQAY